ncbi:MAG: beta-galactosidase trimerization domain-containing protein [Ignavibacteriaceae bacterium]|nr:beta-galactosidase trimerization domain-containing protein [Ignavibacteriaceae bacterium]
MEVNKNNTGKPASGLNLFVGFIILLFAMANFYFILKGTYGKFAVADLFPNLKSLKSLYESKKQNIAILNSAYTKNLLPDGSTWLEDNLKTWKKFSSNFNFKVDEVTDQFLEVNDFSNYDLLILPGSKSLSDKEILKIKKYLEQGGNVLATSGTASFSSDGKWRGWNFFSEVFGIQFSREIKNDESIKTHTLKGGQPVTAEIPAGYALNIATWDKPIAVEVLEPRTIQLSYWYDHKNEPGLVREEIKKSAGIVCGQYGKGRFVWMGFEINSIIGSIDHHVYLERLVKNSLNWLARNPIIYVRDWPNDFNSAALILPYVEENSTSTIRFLQTLKRKKIPASFVIDQEQINLSNEILLRGLAQYGELIPAIALGYPSDLTDTTGKVFDFSSQYALIQNSRSELEKISKSKVSGIFSKHGLFDRHTLSASSFLDFKYLISDSVNGKSLPKNIILDKKRIVVMHKSNKDDNYIIKKQGLVDPEYQFYTLQEDIDRILFEGGLYIYTPHSDCQMIPEYADVSSKVFDDLEQKNFWIVDASEISKWLNMKNQIEVNIKKMGSSRVRLNISNYSKNPAKNIEVDVDLSVKVKDILMSAEIINTKLPRYKKLNDGSLLRLTVDELKPNESRIYFVDYNN